VIVLYVLGAVAVGYVLAVVVVNLVVLAWYAVGALVAWLFPWWGWDPQVGRHRWERQRRPGRDDDEWAD